MANNPSKDKKVLRRGAWSQEEDQKLVAYIARFGIWNWNQLPKHAGLTRTGKSCRLRWLNYLRPGIKRGNITREEEEIIAKLHNSMGNRWAAIAAKLPQRTDNEIKNYYNTRMKKRPRKEEDAASMIEPSAESKNRRNLPDRTNSSSTIKESPPPVSYDLLHVSGSGHYQAVAAGRSVKEEEYNNVGSLLETYNNYEVIQTLQPAAECSNIDSYSRLDLYDDSFYVPFDDFFWATSYL